jgi:hypothetical protein
MYVLHTPPPFVAGNLDPQLAHRVAATRTDTGAPRGQVQLQLQRELPPPLPADVRESASPGDQGRGAGKTAHEPLAEE